jgi:uncharacterized protein with GYD domain
MVRYVTLLRFADQGARKIRESAKRAHASAEAAKKSNVTIKGQYWMMESYDGLLILEAKSGQATLQVPHLTGG